MSELEESRRRAELHLARLSEARHEAEKRLEEARLEAERRIADVRTAVSTELGFGTMGTGRKHLLLALAAGAGGFALAFRRRKKARRGRKR